MDLDFVRKVIEILEESKVDELEVEMGEMRVRVKKSGTPAYSAMPATVPAVPHPLGFHPAEGAPSGEEAGVKAVTAPMVGTFYRAPAPDAPVYVQVGDVVDEGTVVCILEAMKVMNEIKSEVSGTIIEILVENGMPVEFGQPLFKVRAL